MLLPKRVKHRKQFRGSMAGKATRRIPRTPGWPPAVSGRSPARSSPAGR